MRGWPCGSDVSSGTRQPLSGSRRLAHWYRAQMTLSNGAPRTPLEGPSGGVEPYDFRMQFLQKPVSPFHFAQVQ